jgi:hypothetical protein
MPRIVTRGICMRIVNIAAILECQRLVQQTGCIMTLP